jgi:two-component system sensor histidine kinase DesK
MIDAVGEQRDWPSDRRFTRLSFLLWAVWLPFLIAPTMVLLQSSVSPIRAGIVLGAVALFVAVYLWGAFHVELGGPDGLIAPWRLPKSRWLPIAAMYALGFGVVAIDGPNWFPLLIYTGASIGAHLPTRLATGMVAKFTVLTAIAGWLTHAPFTDLGSTVLQVGGIGESVVILCWAVSTNRALRAAREENARLAVTAERLRIARDLHDLLGHDLSLIALKSELAEYLVATSPEQAITAMHDVGSVARTALREVRAAVAGYRQPTLASELRGAQEMLSAAGIACAVEGSTTNLPPAIEAALGWAVREGVTNVIRHSRARSCAIRIRQAADRVSVEIVDDGVGAKSAARTIEPGASANGGSGLSGLAERVASLGGIFEAGPRLQEGFWLFVELPLGSAQPAASAEGHGLKASSLSQGELP